MPRTFAPPSGDFGFEDCIVGMPGPQMVIVNFPGGAPDFERDSDLRNMDIKVLHGGDPSGWRIKKLTRADIKWWQSEVSKALAAQSN